MNNSLFQNLYPCILQTTKDLTPLLFLLSYSKAFKSFISLLTIDLVISISPKDLVAMSDCELDILNKIVRPQSGASKRFQK